MKIRWIKYLLVGLILAGIIIFSAIPIYNIVVNKVPLPGTEKQPIYQPISGSSISKIAPDDSVRNNLLTQDQAWEYTWGFYHSKYNMTIFPPMEKRNLGLFNRTDDRNNPSPKWVFYVMQSRDIVTSLLGVCRGGYVDIDARTGNIVGDTEMC